MNEKPIERLNYYNGQRLEASDLKLEQEYHVRVRRWLNKSLYSSGIARGLGVRAEKDSLNVVVSPGLALDSEGREIILLEEGRKAVIGKHNEVGGVDLGFYLTIQYNEQTIEEEAGGCTPKNGGRKKAAGKLAWGGPSRVLAEPILGWSDSLPHESSGKIVLARVLLDKDCKKIDSVQTDVRRYVGASSASKVRQYALEGERDIDSNNSGRIYFHIRGRQPSAVTLYLRAEKFSTLYYSELGKHEHAIKVDVDPITIQEHSHTITLDPSTNPPTRGTTGPFTSPNPSIDDIRALVGGVITDPFSYCFEATVDPTQRDASLQRWFNMSITFLPPAPHSHAMPSSTDPYSATTITLSGKGSSKPAGVIDQSVRSIVNSNGDETATALTYINNLQIYVGKVAVDGTRPDPGPDDNYTSAILDQLKNAQPAIYGGKNKLGEGRGDENDPLANNGTGAIKLDFLQGLSSFDEGEYYIELKVDSGGGRILYNLYVE
jgi:hypothetical protein